MERYESRILIQRRESIDSHGKERVKGAEIEGKMELNYWDYDSF